MVHHLLHDGHLASPCWSLTVPGTVTHHPKDGHTPSQGNSSTIPRTVTHHPQFGYPPSPGKSPTIPRTITHHPKVGHPNPRTCHPSTLGRLITFPRMVTHHPQDGPTFPRTVTHHTNEGFLAFQGQSQPSEGWSPNIHRIVTQEGHPLLSGMPPTILGMVTHYPNNAQPPSPKKGWPSSHTLPPPFFCRCHSKSCVVCHCVSMPLIGCK